MRCAIYPGSFDPITNGHVDIINRASRLVDEIIVLVIHSVQKHAMFSNQQKATLIRSVFANNPKVKVDDSDGLLVDYAKKKGVFTVIRGLRAETDFSYEFKMALVNRELEKEIESIFLMTDKDHFYVSSSMVREVVTLGGPVARWVPPVVSHVLQPGR